MLASVMPADLPADDEREEYSNFHGLFSSRWRGPGTLRERDRGISLNN